MGAAPNEWHGPAPCRDFAALGQGLGLGLGLGWGSAGALAPGAAIHMVPHGHANHSRPWLLAWRRGNPNGWLGAV